MFRSTPSCTLSVMASNDLVRRPEEFRNYDALEREGVRELYRLNHERQTLEFVRGKKAEYLPPRRSSMGVWDAFDYLAQLVDESDPDLALSQLDHAVQTAEALTSTTWSGIGSPKTRWR